MEIRKYNLRHQNAKIENVGLENSILDAIAVTNVYKPFHVFLENSFLTVLG